MDKKKLHKALILYIEYKNHMDFLMFIKKTALF